VKLLIDECLSPKLAHELCKLGHDAIHPRDYGRLGEKDHEVHKRCIAEDRILVTHNAGDFRKLVGRAEIHPGLIIVESTDVATSLTQIKATIAYVSMTAIDESAADFMVNRVIEVEADSRVKSYLLPKS
jgi:predicted nuclease of predicted toxin-antitoxin system